MDTIDRLLSLDEAAERLNVSRGTLYTLARRGDLTIRKIGRSSRVAESEITRVVRKAPKFVSTAAA